jgi:colanic acid/amylovoran biosynthesis glycosyltransferase
LTKLAILYTTFPRPTETFVRRELKGLLELGLAPDLYSIWKGKKIWEGKKIHLFPPWKILSLIFWIPYWAWNRPNAFKQILTHLWANPCPNLQNWNETFLGLACALVQSSTFKKQNYTQMHAVWATMPSTAALGCNLLTDMPFSVGAHAYDVFRNRGDWLLKLKLNRASFVRTSSESTAKRLRSLGVDKRKLKLIHRSLKGTVERKSFGLLNTSYLSLLSVGRLVEKKGYFFLLAILSELKRHQIPFHMKIIGGGPLKNQLNLECLRLRLENNLSFLDHLNEAEIEKFYQMSDAFLFTGIVAENEDRDGIPNVIPEAMSNGLLVLGSNRAGSSEAFVDRVSGFSLDPQNKESWVEILHEFYKYPDRFKEIRKSAIARSKSCFSREENCLKIKNLFS